MLGAEDWAWELLLDAATLKNIIHTFPRRSLLGNTDTVRVLGCGTNSTAQHYGYAVAVWVGLDV